MTVVDISTKTVVCPKSSKRLFMLQDLDTTDSAILKALAITAIALHNFFHLITPVRQNEFSFSAARFTVFLTSVQHPTMAVQALFAFFGHYGVQVFVFLSAYGLARTHWDQDESWATFMWGRIRKLYPIFLVIVGGWAIGEAVLLGPLLFIKQMGLHLLLMLLGVSTLFGFSLPPIGPWWFIPFIIQFYAIWPLLRKLTHRYGWRLL
ncbi:MAG TPA: acyltransferase family protein, partial [Acidobacteriaceae bacterium]|nr:acyltransferase family protein [Acidobacteriaceae bacterium]